MASIIERLVYIGIAYLTVEVGSILHAELNKNSLPKDFYNPVPQVPGREQDAPGKEDTIFEDVASIMRRELLFRWRGALEGRKVFIVDYGKDGTSGIVLPETLEGKILPDIRSRSFGSLGKDEQRSWRFEIQTDDDVWAMLEEEVEVDMPETTGFGSIRTTIAASNKFLPVRLKGEEFIMRTQVSQAIRITEWKPAKG